MASELLLMVNFPIFLTSRAFLNWRWKATVTYLRRRRKQWCPQTTMNLSRLQTVSCEVSSWMVKIENKTNKCLHFTAVNFTIVYTVMEFQSVLNCQALKKWILVSHLLIPVTKQKKVVEFPAGWQKLQIRYFLYFKTFFNRRRPKIHF